MSRACLSGGGKGRAGAHGVRISGLIRVETVTFFQGAGFSLSLFENALGHPFVYLVGWGVAEEILTGTFHDFRLTSFFEWECLTSDTMK